MTKEAAMTAVAESGVISDHAPYRLGSGKFGDYDECVCGWTGYGHHGHLAFQVGAALAEGQWL